MIVAGIDGCPTGWVCLTKSLTDDAFSARVLATIAELALVAPPVDVAAIDAPIGLPDSGPRECDRAARVRLGRGRASSVFPAPLRAMLAATTQAEASAIGRAIDGRGLTVYAWGIVPKIREVDAFLRSEPAWRGTRKRPAILREVHPELSFATWNGGPLRHGKKSAAGRAEREALVDTRYAGERRLALAILPRGGWSNDDLLDAFAALWTAERIAAGTAIVLPADPPIDACGLRMEIVA